MAMARTKTKLKFRRLPDKRPNQIMDAAEQVFGKYGFQAASLDKIAKAAGITKGTIYLYFRSKRDLFLNMMKRRARAMLDELSERITNKGITNFRELFSEALPSIRNFMRDPDYPNFIKLVMAESGRFPKLGSEFYRGIPLRGIEFASKAYISDLSMGKVKNLDPKIVIQCLIGMHLVFIITQEILGAKEFDPIGWDEIEKTIDTIFWDGVRRVD